MKNYKTVIVPATEATTVQELESTTCDICGATITQGSHSEEKVSVQMKTGFSFPEGGSGEIKGVDMCTPCFLEKLVPWLESQGCKLHTVDWGW